MGKDSYIKQLYIDKKSYISTFKRDFGQDQKTIYESNKSFGQGL